MVTLIAGLFLTTVAAQGITANTADALFFERYGVENLPRMILIAGVVVLIATVVHMMGQARVGPARWLPWVYAALGGWAAVERLTIPLIGRPIYPVIWLGGQVTIWVTFAAVWSAAAETCDTRQAKRLFPLFAAAGIVGGVLGNVATGPLAAALGTDNLLWVQSVILVAAVGFVVISRRFFLEQGGSASGLSALGEGLRIARRDPLMRLAAVAAIALNALFYLVVFPFSSVVAASFSGEAELAGFLGFFSAAATALTFVFSLLVTSHLLGRLGVVWTLAIVPSVYLAGFALWFVVFDLGSAVVFRGMQWVAVNAILAPVWTSLFNVFTGRRRSRSLAFVAAVPTQLGVMVSGAVLLVLSAASSRQLFVTGLALAAMALVLVLRMRPRYQEGLISSVRVGVLGLFAAPTAIFGRRELDADLERELTAALDDPNPRMRGAALAILAGVCDAGAAPLIDRGLADDAPSVRAAALHAGSANELIDIVPRAQALLGDDSPSVRRGAIDVLIQAEAVDPVSFDEAMTDTDPVVRAAAASVVGGTRGRETIRVMLGAGITQAATALEAVARTASAAAAGETTQALVEPELLRRYLDSTSVRVRRAAADALVALPDGGTLVDEVLRDGSVRASQAIVESLAASGRGGASLHAWVEDEIQRAQRLGRWHRSLDVDGDRDDGQGSDATCAYLGKVLEARRHRLIGWAILALSNVETRDRVSLMSRAVWVEGRETRAQAVEALETMGRDIVGTAMMEALDEPPDRGGGDRRAALVEMTQDVDRWIASLAARALGEDFDSVQRVSGREVEMDVIPTLDVIDRVLALARVPLFEELDPEDLELIAGVSGEVRYEAGETIYRVGESGNSMLMVIDGEAIISRDEDGAKCITAVLGAGEPVGELALLRSRPRSADVSAGEAGLHGLVIQRSDLMTILQERPQVAMSMLATLAERLGRT